MKLPLSSTAAASCLHNTKHAWLQDVEHARLSRLLIIGTGLGGALYYTCNEETPK